MPMIAYDLQRPFAVDFFLQSPQGLLNGLAFFQFNFCQSNSHPLRDFGPRRLRQPSLFSQADEGIFPIARCQPANSSKRLKKGFLLAFRQIFTRN
jgi:hypothetical protein